MNVLMKALLESADIALFGHVNPDGDCVGSCLALRQYLQDNEPEKRVRVYLESVGRNLLFLSGADQVLPLEEASNFDGDLCISLDAGSLDRLGEAGEVFRKAKKTLVIDHHITNTHFGMENWVDGAASSCCQVLYELLDDEKISKPCAEALYTGIVHDTGVFRFSNTSERTMQIAGRLMSRGLATNEIIDRSFYQKTFLQTKVMAKVVGEARMMADSKVLLGVLTNEQMHVMGATSEDTDGIIDQLRLVKGVEVAIFAREDAPHVFKFSLRSNGKVDVSAVSTYFGGGGHRLAAGFTAKGELEDILNELMAMILSDKGKYGWNPINQ